MTKYHNTPRVATATYMHEAMTRAAFEAYLASVYGDRELRGVAYTGDFYDLEYFNSPLGLIVNAYHGMNGCDAFYPVSVDFKNETQIEPFPGAITPVENIPEPNFLHHRMGRKTTGFLIYAAYGGTINCGDPEATSISLDFRKLEVFDSCIGLIVAALKGNRAYVIRPVEMAKAQEAA